MTTTQACPANVAVRLENIVKCYDTAAGTVAALRGVSAQFHSRTFTAVMGPSGSGKSTLLHCAAGLDHVSEGRVYIAGNDLTGLSEKKLTLLRRQYVGFTFQSYNLVSSLTVGQNLELGFRLARRRPAPGAIERALTDVGLGPLAQRYPSQLSGGQQQRVAIARALVMQPAVLFADEPTGALDLTTSRGVMDLLRRAVDELGQTVVMVTHEAAAAAAADRVLLLADGKVVDELAGPGLDPRDVASRIALLETA